jgi:surfeit locus 1 family protein
MRIGPYQFRPKLIPTLVTVVLMPVLLSLGFWQLDRSEEKRKILEQQEQTSQLPTLQITGKNEILDTIAYRRLAVTGRFLGDYLIMVDNKVHNGQVGFFVVTPFRIEGSDTAVLVNRGWVRATGDRNVLPDITTPQDTMTIYGTAKLNTKDIVSFSDQNRLGDGWPALVRWVDIPELEKTIPYKLKEYLLLQEPASQQDYVRDWKLINSTPAKNLSYAVQWFSLATALLLIFIFVNTKRCK